MPSLIEQQSSRTDVMQRWTELAQVPTTGARTVVAIGNFDGVHLGHRALLSRLRTLGNEIAADTAVVTFAPHPLAVLHPERAPVPLTTSEYRLDLLEQAGVDATLQLPFTRELAAWSPRRFVEQILVQSLGAVSVVVGGDFRFGKGNSGDVGTLRALGQTHGFEVVVLKDQCATADQQQPAGASRRLSSTWVRELLAAGHVKEASTVLGRPHRLEGRLSQTGGTTDGPAGRLRAMDVLIPADGVYAARLTPISGTGAGTRANEPRAQAIPGTLSVRRGPACGGMTCELTWHPLDEGARLLQRQADHVAVDVLVQLQDGRRRPLRPAAAGLEVHGGSMAGAGLRA